MTKQIILSSFSHSAKFPRLVFIPLALSAETKKMDRKQSAARAIGCVFVCVCVCCLIDGGTLWLFRLLVLASFT